MNSRRSKNLGVETVHHFRKICLPYVIAGVIFSVDFEICSEFPSRIDNGIRTPNHLSPVDRCFRPSKPRRPASLPCAPGIQSTSMISFTFLQPNIHGFTPHSGSQLIGLLGIKTLSQKVCKRVVFGRSMEETCATIGKPQWKELGMEETQRVHEESQIGPSLMQSEDLRAPALRVPGMYTRELDVAVRAVQLACALCHRVQDRLLKKEVKINSKDDNSFVTVADWSVQAVVSWALSECFPEEHISMVAEEDTQSLRGMDGIDLLQGVVGTVNECLSGASIFGLEPPQKPLGTVDILKAINRGGSKGGPTGRHWVLDPVDGTLGFVRGDQYAVALGMIEEGEVVLGVLGCPNYPMKREWLNYHHRYYRLMSKLSPPASGVWNKGCVLSAQKGTGQAWMEPLLYDRIQSGLSNVARPVTVSSTNNPELATFCEPVERANSSHSFTAGLAHSLGLRNHPLRVYSMAKYAAIARGDAEIFMKFARVGYKEKIWDHAAGVLIIQEAGGVVTDAGGCPLDFSKGIYLEGLDRGIIASSGVELHEKIIAAVDASWDSSEL